MDPFTHTVKVREEDVKEAYAELADQVIALTTVILAPGSTAVEQERAATRVVRARNHTMAAEKTLRIALREKYEYEKRAQAKEKD